MVHEVLSCLLYEQHRGRDSRALMREGPKMHQGVRCTLLPRRLGAAHLPQRRRFNFNQQPGSARGHRR